MFRGSARSLLDQRSRQAASRAALCIAAIGVTTLAGCASGLTLLCQWIPGYPPASLGSAVGLLAMAAAFWSHARRGDTARLRRLIPIGIMFVLGLSSLIERATDLPVSVDVRIATWLSLHESMGGMAPFTAASFLLGAVGLWAITWHHRRNGSVVAGICGTLLGVVAIAIILVYVTHVVEPLSPTSMVKMSLPSAVAFLIAGVTVVLLTWRKDTALMPLPGWAAIALGIATMVTTLLFWFAFSRQEEQRESAALARQAEATRQQVTARIDETIARLCQSGVIAMSEPARWPVAVQRSLAISPALEGSSIYRLGEAIRPGDIQARRPEVAGLLREILSGDQQTVNAPTVRTIPFASGDFLAFRVPICGLDSLHASTLSLWRAKDLLGLAVASATPAYAVRLDAGSRQILALDTVALADSSLPLSTLAFSHAGMDWRLEIRPGSTARHLLHPAIPGLIGVLGVVLSLLLTLTVGLLRVTVTSARQSERERMARGLESSTEGLWEWHPRTGETIRSKVVWERLGYDMEALSPDDQSQRWVGLVPIEERVRVQDLLREHLEGRADRFEAEYPVRAADGSTHWVADRGRIVERDTEGRPMLIMGICTDVTERRLAEEGLATSERQFRAVFDSGYQLQWLLDPDCHLLEANRTALEFAGVTLDQVLGEPFWSTAWWSHCPESQNRLLEACQAASQGRPFSSEEEMVSSDGRQAMIDFSLTPIRDEHGRLFQFLAEARDITDRKRAQDALREMDALSAMGRVAARAAHEINNPLAGIQNAFLLIKDAIPTTHPHFEYVGAIEREVSRIAGITRQLYETYRPERESGGSGAPATLIISDAVRLLEQINRKTSVTIEIDVSGTPGVVPVSAALLRQAVYNLVQNGVEASPPGSVVHVRTWRDAEGFWLAVRDHGQGIPVELRDSIFRPFVTTKADMRGGGVGLGLSLVRRSVSTMNGRIEIVDPPDGGTEIRVFIPIPDQGAAAHA